MAPVSFGHGELQGVSSSAILPQTHLVRDSLYADTTELLKSSFFSAHRDLCVVCPAALDLE